MEQILEFLKPIIETYSSFLPPVVIQILIIIGSLRTIVKPLMALFQAYVDITPSIKDDALPQKVKEHKAYKIVSFIFDWVFSLKLPKAKK